MKCMHSVTDEHGAKMACTADGDMVIVAEATDYPASMGRIVNYRYFCRDHVGLHSGRPNVIEIITAEQLQARDA